MLFAEISVILLENILLDPPSPFYFTLLTGLPLQAHTYYTYETTFDPVADKQTPRRPSAEIALTVVSHKLPEIGYNIS